MAKYKKLMQKFNSFVTISTNEVQRKIRSIKKVAGRAWAMAGEGEKGHFLPWKVGKTVVLVGYIQ